MVALWTSLWKSIAMTCASPESVRRFDTLDCSEKTEMTPTAMAPITTGRTAVTMISSMSVNPALDSSERDAVG
jgi:hypothetical protein